MILAPFLSVIPPIIPLLELRSPMISPMYSSGVVTSTLNTGSRIIGLDLAAACLTAIDPASLNAISDESTSWYDPS